VLVRFRKEPCPGTGLFVAVTATFRIRLGIRVQKPPPALPNGQCDRRACHQLEDPHLDQAIRTVVRPRTFP
jgi:hypothetical protein